MTMIETKITWYVNLKKAKAKNIKEPKLHIHNAV